MIKKRISRYLKQWGDINIPEEYFRENIDIIRIISIIFKKFNVKNFLDSKSTKASRALGVRDETVKNEPLYFSVIYTSIINSAPYHFKIDPEVPLKKTNDRTKLDTKQLKVDMVLQNGDNICAIELVAHVDPSTVKAHIDKTVIYKKLLNAKQAFVIHFTTSPDEKMQDYTKLINDEVTVLHIQHSSNFDIIKLYKNLDDPIIIRKTDD